jgi:hypothetical protein
VPSLPVARPTIPQLRKLRRHRRVAPGQLCDRDLLRLVVCEAQVAIGAQQRIPGFLQVLDRFVDLVDGRLKATGGELVVLADVLVTDRALEGVQVILEARDVDALRLHQSELGLVGERVQGGVAQNSDHGDEELRPQDVHFRMSVRDIHDRFVDQLIGLWSSLSGSSRDTRTAYSHPFRCDLCRAL